MNHAQNASNPRGALGMDGIFGLIGTSARP
jgi:hypothetical protein